MPKEEVWEKKIATMIVSMTSKIQELAEEASDPEEAGRKMELGAPGSRKAAGWLRQKSPQVRGCAV